MAIFKTVTIHRPCDECRGAGRVQAIDTKACTGWRNRIFLKALKAQERADREDRAYEAAERRMGA